MPRIVAIGPPLILNSDWLTFTDTKGVLLGQSSLPMRSFSFSGSRGVFKMWHTRRAIASERGGPVVSTTSKSASALSRVEGVATGCSGSKKESEGSRRLTTSAAPSPFGVAGWSHHHLGSTSLPRRIIVSHLLWGTCSFLGEGVAGSFNGRMCCKPLPGSVGHNQRISLHGCRQQLHWILHGGTNGFRQHIDVGIYRRRSRHAGWTFSSLIVCWHDASVIKLKNKPHCTGWIKCYQKISDARDRRR